MSCDGRQWQTHGLGNRDGHGRLLLENRCVGYVGMVGVRRVLLLLCTTGLDGLLCACFRGTYLVRVGWKGPCVGLLRLVVSCVRMRVYLLVSVFGPVVLVPTWC